MNIGFALDSLFIWWNVVLTLYSCPEWIRLNGDVCMDLLNIGNADVCA